MQDLLQILEPIFLFLDSKASFINGFTMAGVILILFGIQKVTRKDLSEYIKKKKNFDKSDTLIAWGIFYIIFGTLIAVSTILTVSLYF